MHRSKLSLRTWLEAIHLLTCHSNGISAEQAQAQLGLGSYKTAWLLLHKLRRAMVNPKRTFIVSDACLVAISKTSRQALTWADIASSAGRGRRGRGAVALQA